MKGKNIEIIIAVILLIGALGFVFYALNDGKGMERNESSPLQLVIPTSLTPVHVLFGIVIFVLIFLILREFNTWYWKINKAIKLLEKIEKNTRK